jgi:hypothetical protein
MRSLPRHSHDAATSQNKSHWGNCESRSRLCRSWEQRRQKKSGKSVMPVSHEIALSESDWRRNDDRSGQGGGAGQDTERTFSDRPVSFDGANRVEGRCGARYAGVQRRATAHPSRVRYRRGRVDVYSTVTLFARLRGRSTLQPRRVAMWYERSCSGIDVTSGCRYSSTSGT